MAPTARRPAAAALALVACLCCIGPPRLRPRGFTAAAGRPPWLPGGRDASRERICRKFFDLAGTLKENAKNARTDFVQNTLLEWCGKYSKPTADASDRKITDTIRRIKVLELWPPMDLGLDRGQRSIKAVGQRVCEYGGGEITVWYVAGSGYGNFFDEMYGKVTPHVCISINLCKWTEDTRSLRDDYLEPVGNNLFDVAICDDAAIDRMGEEGFAAAVSETHRCLKPGSEFWLFSREDQTMPDFLKENFEVIEDLQGKAVKNEYDEEADEWIDVVTNINGLKLTPKKTAAPARKRRRRRKVDASE